MTPPSTPPSADVAEALAILRGPDQKHVLHNRLHIANVLSAALSDAVERTKAEEALTKINVIRNSIVGLATVDWSEHIYPLVAALNAAGFKGMDYPEAREMFGTMLDRTKQAEAALASSETARRELEKAAQAVVDDQGCRVGRAGKLRPSVAALLASLSSPSTSGKNT